MIVANLATYPPRRAHVIAVVRNLAAQVDRLNIVLNEYSEPLEELAAFSNVVQVVPPKDTKDTGKFLPVVDKDDTVFLVDDDLVYPKDYVAAGLAAIRGFPDTPHVFGYHGCTYRRPRPSLSRKRLRQWWTYDPARIAEYRKVIPFQSGRSKAYRVDQIGTGTAIVKGRDLPPFSYMESSQSFVDVRLAKWCFENGVVQVVLPKAAGWIQSVAFDQSIYIDFTRRNPSHVADEIRSYAYTQVGVGEVYQPSPQSKAK